MAAGIEATFTTMSCALLQFMVQGDENLSDELPTDMVKGNAETLRGLIRLAASLEA